MAAAAAAALALTMPILDEQNVVVDDKKLSLSRRQDFQIATTVEEEHEPKERLLVDDHEDEGCSVVSLEPASSSSSSESYSGDCTPSTSSFSSIAGSPLCTPTRVENDDDEEARIEFDLDSLKGKGKQTTSRYAAEIVRREAKALLDLAARLDRFQLSDAPSSAAANVVDNVDDAAASFDRAVELLSSMDPHGKVIITGIGKSGLLARKAVATFNSLGIPSVFLHPVEALHGDMGIVSPHGVDTVILISYSGKTSELLTLTNLLRKKPVSIAGLRRNASSFANDGRNNLQQTTRSRCHGIISITRPGSPLAQASDVCLDASLEADLEADEAVPAPTSSVLVALSLLDSLALTLLRSATGWDDGHLHRRAVFAAHHPGGNLGQVLAAD